MATIVTADIWFEKPIALRTGRSSGSNEDVIDAFTTDRDKEFLMNPRNIGPTHVEVQHMNTSSLRIFDETTSELDAIATVVGNVVISQSFAIREAENSENALFS